MNRRRAIWVLAAVVLLVDALGVLIVERGSGSKSRPLIVTAAVTRRTIQDQLTLSGTLGREVQRTVTAGTAAQISDVSVADGGLVNAAQSVLGLNGREMVAEPGSVPFFRALGAGDSGPDVAQLNQILGAGGSVFTAQTESDLGRWQAAHGYPGTAPATALSLTVALQPSSAYTLGPRSSAGLTIGGGASTTSSVRRQRAILTAATTPTLSIEALNTKTVKGAPAIFVVYSSSQAPSALRFSLSESGDAPADEVLPPTGPLTLPAGASSVEVQVPTRANGLVQPAATLTVGLNPGVGYEVGGPSTASTTIASSDVPELTVLGGGNVSPGSTATFTIVADQAPVEDTSVNVEIAGSAQPGQDFLPVPTTLVLPAGRTQVGFALTTLNRSVTFQPTDMITGKWPIRVGDVTVKAGDAVAPGAELFTLTDTAFTVTLSASPTNRTVLQVGQAVTVELQGDSTQVTGEISQLDSNVNVDPSTKAQTYSGKVAVAGSLGGADGATVSITVNVRAAENVLAVPIAAVKQNGDGQDVVRVIDLEHGARITEVPVRTGLSDSSYIEVAGGLSEGQVVVVETDKGPG